MHDQTALRTDGIDHLLEQFPDAQAEMDTGYRGLHRDHPAEVERAAKEPARRRPPRGDSGLGQARTPSHRRICVDAIAGSKH